MANSVTVPRDNFINGLRSIQNRISMPHGGSTVSFDYMQGDLLYWDSTVQYVKPLDSDAHAANLVGVALRSAYLAPYYSMQLSGGPGPVKNYFDWALIGFGDVYSFFTTAGDSYVPGQSVYFGADAQTITNVAATKVIGTIWNPAGGAIAGGAGVMVNVLVVPQTPIQSL
jgi:hypothetical protein